jgi:hypothetical protein
MRFSIAGWVMAGLLVALVVTVVVYQFIDRTVRGIDLIYIVMFISVGFLGAAASASIGTLSKTDSFRAKSAIWVAGIIFVIASFASLFAGGSSVSAAYILISLIVVAMMTRVSLNTGDVSWKIVGRVVAVIVLLYIVGVLALYANNCGADCLNARFAVPFVSLGLLGAALCIWRGQITERHSANTRLAFNTGVAVLLALSIASFVSGVSVISVEWVVVAAALIGTWRSNDAAPTRRNRVEETSHQA